MIINISSSGALVPLPTVVPYSGAKAALNAMTVSLAREYGPTVRVNAISAGPFLTDISKAWSEEARETSPNSLGPTGTTGRDHHYRSLSGKPGVQLHDRRHRPLRWRGWLNVSSARAHEPWRRRSPAPAGAVAAFTIYMGLSLRVDQWRDD